MASGLPSFTLFLGAFQLVVEAGALALECSDAFVQCGCTRLVALCTASAGLGFGDRQKRHRPRVGNQRRHYLTVLDERLPVEVGAAAVEHDVDTGRAHPRHGDRPGFGRDDPELFGYGVHVHRVPGGSGPKPCRHGDVGRRVATVISVLWAGYVRKENSVYGSSLRGMGPVMIVPDYPVALRGWKSFGVRVERNRASLHDRDDRGTTWWPGEVHRVDSGIFALRTAASTLEVVRDAAIDESDICIAVVECWGEVTLNSMSLRATQAYPQALWIPFDGSRRRARRHASRLSARLDDYGIRATAIERGEWFTAFDRAYADVAGQDAPLVESAQVGETDVVVEPLVTPVPEQSVRRRPAATDPQTDHRGLFERFGLHRPPHGDVPS